MENLESRPPLVHEVKGTGVPRAWEIAFPLGPYSRPTPRAQRWSDGGGGVSYERGTPVVARTRWLLLRVWFCASRDSC